MIKKALRCSAFFVLGDNSITFNLLDVNQLIVRNMRIFIVIGNLKDQQ